jgi:surfeit locus 1 family protein
LLKYQFKPSWLGALVTVCCIPIFIKLGLWQYHKAQQKQALQDSYDHYLHADPVEIPELIAEPEAWRYRQVKVTGAYETQYQILLDNQVSNEQVGYDVITPLHISNTDRYVLVDRGWIPAQDDHSSLPAIDTPAGEQEVVGQVWLPSSKFYSLDGSVTGVKSDWQMLWQNMDMKRYSASTPFKLSPLVIRLDAASQTGGFKREWQQPAERIGMYLSYAYQWFGFAVAAVAIYLFVSFKKISVPTAPAQTDLE